MLTTPASLREKWEDQGIFQEVVQQQDQNSVRVFITFRLVRLYLLIGMADDMPPCYETDKSYIGYGIKFSVSETYLRDVTTPQECQVKKSNK